VINGLRQGGVLSAVILLLYIDGLLVKSSSTNVCCYVCEFFVGILAYADDIVLLAATSSVMRQLLEYVMSVLTNIA